MEMTALRELHRQMLDDDIQHQIFRMQSGAVDLEFLFSVDVTPFELAMTVANTKEPEFFLFEVKAGYYISPNLGDDYKRLANALRIHGESFKLFEPRDFLNDLNLKIPKTVKQKPNAPDFCRLRCDIEERNKPYFDGWINWQKGQKPSKENLTKTRLILGQEAYEWSKLNSRSSRWSTHPKKS